MSAVAEIIAPDRAKFIGGSDAAAILGVSPWKTPVELWMSKTGRMPPEEISPERRKMLDRGHKLEPFIREMVITKLEDFGVTVDLLACNQRYADPEHAFMSCEIDFELRLTGEMEIGGEPVQFDGEDVNADAKSVTGFARKKWGDENTEDVPIEYAAQFMHGLMVTPGKRRFCLVAALRSFDDVDIYWTRRDDETIAAMRAKEITFWYDHVQADVAPDAFTFDDVKLLFPCDNGLSVDATSEIALMVHDLARIKSQIKGLEEAEERLKLEIADFISPHAVLKFDDKEIATWKGQRQSRFDEKRFKEDHPALAAQYMKSNIIRVLRLKKGI